MPLELDHVIVCVPDLDEAAGRYERDHGVVSVEGGRHPGHGTANRIIPLGSNVFGSNYIELLAVVDPDEASTSTFGTWAGQRAKAPGAAAVCLRTNDLDGVTQRLGLQPVEMSRATPDGTTLSWRLAGLSEAISEDLPFFIEWKIPDELHPGRINVEHPAGEVLLVGTCLNGDVDRLREWAPNPKGVTYVPVSDSIRSISFRLVPFGIVEDN